MSTIFRKSVVCATLLASCGAATAAYCPVVVDSIWQEGVNAAGTTIESAIEAMVDTIATNRLMNLQRIQSALKILTKQIQLSTEKEISAEVSAKQAGATVLAAVSNRKAMFNTMMDYNGATGQGFDPCAELRRSKEVAVAIGEAQQDMQEKVIREIDAAPGRLVASQSAVVAKRLQDAKTTYCTSDEARMGICQTIGTLAGKDVDAGHFFSSSAHSSPESGAKSALLNHMYGVPYQALKREDAMTPTGRAALDAKRTEDAYRSVSQASMKAIQSWTESRGSNGASSASVLDTLAKKINTYAGGENYAAWEKSKTAQSERGLLVEYAKMAALELYMLNLEYQQAERIEANIAAWQALKATSMKDGAAAPVQAVAARGQVR